MKTRFIFIPIMLALALATALSSCTRFANAMTEYATKMLDHNYEDSEELGKVVENKVEVRPFAKMDINGAVKVVLTQDSVCTLEVRGNEKCVAEYTITVDDNELDVRRKDGSSNVNEATPRITIYVTAPRMEEVELNGACELSVPGKAAFGGDMEIAGNGASGFNIDTLEVDNLELEMNGAGKVNAAMITASGKVGMEANGAGKIDAQVFCDKLSVEFNGAGKAVLSGECNSLRERGSNAACDIDTSGLKVN